MGSSFSQQLCCALCERCRKHEEEAADGESSETKPILQSPGYAVTFSDTQPLTAALSVPRQGSKDLPVLIQDCQPSADALEENGETCSATDPMGMADGWEAAWNPMDLCVAPADEEVEDVEGFTFSCWLSASVENTEEEIKPVPEVQPVGDPAVGAELVAEQEQPRDPGHPGSEGATCAGTALQEGNILTLLELLSEAEPGQDCEMEPPAAPGEVPTGREPSPSVVQVAGEPERCLSAGQGTDRAEPAEMSPQGAQRAELTWLVEAVSLLTVQNPLEVTAKSVAEPCSVPAVSWESLCLQWGSPEPRHPQCDLSKQGVQGALSPAQAMGSLRCVEPVGPSELLQQPGAGALCGLGQEGSRGCAAGTQHGIMQQTLEPQEVLPSVPMPAKQEAELPNVSPSLPEELGRSGEMEAANAEA